MIGIYSIKSKVNPSKIYIGSAKNIELRWKNHIKELKSNRHHSIILQNHYNKYGINDLQFSIIEECLITDLIDKEQKYIDLFKPKFNIRKIASSNIGLKRSNITKSKMSDAWKTRIPMSDETKQKISNSRKGKKLSEEIKNKLSKSRKGIKFSNEHKEKLKQVHLGKKQTFEHIEKRRLKMFGNKSRTGYKETEEHKLYRLSKTKYKKGPESHRYNIVASDETKNKMKLSQLKRWEKRRSLREIEFGFSTKPKEK